MAERLNWGCGRRGESGWVNSDIRRGPDIDLCCDITLGLPVADETFDYAVSIHALSMISHAQLVPVLQELRRVLKPGGVLRLGLPDLERGIAAYLRQDVDYFLVPDADASSLGGKFVTHMLWYGHSTTMFTVDFIEELLDKSGFADVQRCGYRQSYSQYAEEIVELDNREQESLFVEAIK